MVSAETSAVSRCDIRSQFFRLKLADRTKVNVLGDISDANDRITRPT